MKFDGDVKRSRDSILRDQMNYAEQKIHEIGYNLTASYREDIVDSRKTGAKVDISRENKEYILYQESLGAAMVLIKNQTKNQKKSTAFNDARTN